MKARNVIVLVLVHGLVLWFSTSMAQMYELVLDNTDPEHEQYGTWTEYPLPGSHGNNTVHAKPAGTGSAYFRYLLPAGGSMALGEYAIYARWASHSVLATNTKYRVYPGVGSTDVRVNQKTNHARWVKLGTWDITHPRPVVRVYDDADGYVAADGIKYVRLGASSAPPLEMDLEGLVNADEVE